MNISLADQAATPQRLPGDAADLPGRFIHRHFSAMLFRYRSMYKQISSYLGLTFTLALEENWYSIKQYLNARNIGLLMKSLSGDWQQHTCELHQARYREFRGASRVIWFFSQ